MEDLYCPNLRNPGQTAAATTVFFFFFFFFFLESRLAQLSNELYIYSSTPASGRNKPYN
jgi:hypothetical protein